MGFVTVPGAQPIAVNKGHGGAGRNKFSRKTGKAAITIHCPTADCPGLRGRLFGCVLRTQGRMNGARERERRGEFRIILCIEFDRRATPAEVAALRPGCAILPTAFIR